LRGVVGRRLSGGCGLTLVAAARMSRPRCTLPWVLICRRMPAVELPMIPATPLPAQPAATWQRLWRDAVREPDELLELLGLPGLASRLAGPALRDFPLRVPRGFVARMRHGDPADPLLRQVPPLDAEDRPVPGFGVDA